MQVPPHPHIGLQTVSWLFEGLVLHRDSLGSRQMIRPGEPLAAPPLPSVPLKPR
jgi:quercetin 2,3-dioxygenase